MNETSDKILDGIPPELAVLTDEHAVRLEVDETLYPLDAVYGAAYVFIDRCWVLLDKPMPERVRVTLAPKAGVLDEKTARALAGEFANELLSCAWRHSITVANRKILETVTEQAIAGAVGPPSLEDLEQYDFSSEAFEDPLGIALSWEEKYKKKTPEKP